jgi:hypothetical protein
MLAKDKQSSFLVTFVNYGSKTFYNIVSRFQDDESFMEVTNTASDKKEGSFWMSG